MVLALAFALLAPHQAVPAAADDLARLVPPGALLVIESASPAELHSAFVGHDFGRMTLGPAGLFVRLAQEAGGLPDGSDPAAIAALLSTTEPSAEVAEAAGVHWAAIHDALRTSTGRMQLHVVPDANFDEVAVVVAVQTNGSARAALDRLFGLVEHDYSWKEKLGFELAVDANGLDDDEFVFACRDDLALLVAGSHPSTLRRELKRLLDGVTKGTLVAPESTALVAARAAVAPTHQLRVLLDATRLVELFEAEALGEDAGLTENQAEGVRSLGIGAMRFAALGFTIGENAHFDVEGALAFPTSGLLHDLCAAIRARAPKELLAVLPGDATSVQVTSVDLARCVELVDTWLDTYAPEISAAMAEELAPFEESTGLVLVDELVAIFGGAFVSYTTPDMGPNAEEVGMAEYSLVPEALDMFGRFVVDVRDTARLETLFTRTSTFAKEETGEEPPFEVVDVGGQVVRGLDGPDGSFWFGWRDGVLAMGSSAEGVAADLVRDRSGELAVDARLAQALAENQDAMSVAAMDTKAMLELAARTLGFVASLGGGAEYASGITEHLTAVAGTGRGVMTSGYRLESGVLRMFVRGR